MSAVKVGQVWQDKDKRRNTVIEVLTYNPVTDVATGLVVGTEEEREYKGERLLKRWTSTVPRCARATARRWRWRRSEHH